MSVGYGVYIHIPFCARRCDYCAFATWTDRIHLAEAYTDALHTELQRAIASGEVPPVTSVFVGGGTPSMIPAALLGRLVESIPTVVDAEVTVECNPDDVTPDLVSTYRDHGVNRISLGVQSMVPHVLKGLGRWHQPDNVVRAVDVVVDGGVPTFNLDLIYGSVGETNDDWTTTLTEVLRFRPPHISAYGLTVEAGTPLAADPARHPDDDVQADRYIAADAAFIASGLDNYEISNWAMPGHESRHNQLYWAQGNYLGLGSAAHSHQDGRRWWRVRTPERYIELVRTGTSTEAAGEILDEATRRFERLELSLRTRDGVPQEALDVDGLDDFVSAVDGRVVLTRQGRLMANQIALRLRP